MKKGVKIGLGLGVIGLVYLLLKNKGKLSQKAYLNKKLKLVEDKHKLIKEVDDKRIDNAKADGNAQALAEAKRIKAENQEKSRLEKARLEKAKRDAEALQLTKAEQKRLQKLEDARLALALRNAKSLAEKNRLKEEARLALIERKRLAKELSDLKIAKDLQDALDRAEEDERSQEQIRQMEYFLEVQRQNRIDAENRRQRELEAERRRIEALKVLSEEIRNEKQDSNDRGYGGTKPLPLGRRYGGVGKGKRSVGAQLGFAD